MRIKLRRTSSRATKAHPYNIDTVPRAFMTRRAVFKKRSAWRPRKKARRTILDYRAGLRPIHESPAHARDPPLMAQRLIAIEKYRKDPKTGTYKAISTLKLPPGPLWMKPKNGRAQKTNILTLKKRSLVPSAEDVSTNHRGLYREPETYQTAGPMRLRPEAPCSAQAVPS